MITTTAVPAKFWRILAAGTGGILLLEAALAAVMLTVLASFTTSSYAFDGQEGMAAEFGVLFAVLGGAGLLLLLATAVAVLVAALRNRRALAGAGRVLAVVCCLLHALAAVSALVREDAYMASAVLPALLLAAVLLTRRTV
ncbi:hypothetical protein [Streptomyces sp. TLI_185]|uniref:hypothetical protein n=1 Tax=Streptomyces sp. TLI_185 TaxID=2485151 RepID=UPI000F4E66FC|nr:hypothetical protein [Streptomyces sp. TLI_185]RPF33032.1 hypothetical protein EDD92_2931 [Streptomyces sp. TLI_185]